MLTNYYSIDENSTVGSFLRENKDKKNMQYIILETSPKSFVDIRTICLKLHNPQEKLKQLKKPLSWLESSERGDLLQFLLESGDRVIEHPEGYFDFLQALEHIKEINPDFLGNSLEDEVRLEVYAVNEDDKISTAKKLLVQKRVNLLPVIKDLKVVGEFRTRDLLTSNLFDKQGNSDLYNEKNRSSLFNSEVSNLMNSKPLTLDYTTTLGEAVDLMLTKKIPSLIVTKDDELYSIVTYKDIFKRLRKESQNQNFKVELVGTGELFDDEIDLIKDFAERSMTKITKMSDYGLLKIVLKVHGNNEGTHKKKASVKLSLSKGNKVLNVDKEISAGTSDETFNDKVKGKWNIPQLAQDALRALEKKVIDEKRRNKN